ncbi:MAG TPA: hypothetical protein VIK83_04865, partial [Coriobacteriia bacterium]
MKGISMGNLMSHIEHLSETIGPRPAATDAEEQAARYIGQAFEARGLEAQTQTFDTPRSSGWAFVLYHVLTILAAAASHFSALPALLLGLGVWVVMWLDLDTRWGLTSLMPKGPSQNVIARHVPRLGRNERATRVVVVAHYDSARTSLATGPAMVRNHDIMTALMKASTFAVPVLVAVRMLLAMIPAAKVIEPWAWYLTLVPAVFLLIPLFVAVQSEIFARFSPGANDNASGVAALLGVFERLVPEPDASVSPARDIRRTHPEATPVDLGPDDDFMPADSLLNYSPVQAPPRRAETWTDDDDISWDTGVISGQTALGLDAKRPEAAPPTPVRAPVDPENLDPDDEASLRLFGAPAWKAPAPDRPAQASAAVPSRTAAPPSLDFDDLDEETAPFDALGSARTDAAPAPQPDPPRRGLFGGRSADVEKRGVRDWLGVGNDFDARKKGKDIGSWDNF